ncbi:MAG: carbohydrate binding domain-containing protein [Muribaculaceae bacterium]|nr:carbohydrate binding domain-containing protein [Muribaculaceae bacterium]
MKIRQILAFSLFTLAQTMAAQVVINIDANQRGPMISPVHYGIFYEDINHAADGGLYAELIRNRSFEDDTTPCNWFSVGDAQIALVQDDLLNEVQHNALDVTLVKPGDGVRNEGFWGINAVKGREYRLSFWAKSDKKYKGTITARLQSASGQTLGEENLKVSLSKDWKKYTATISATGTDPKAEFTLTADKPGQFQLDVVSLFPPTFKDRENGMRPDLAQMLADMNPSFMRFPGGCFVEGQISPDNAFRWKRTIGPIEKREGHQNVNWGYRTSDGIGFHEYLQLAEDLGAKPLFVVNVGIWHGGCTPYDQIGDWIQECLDALEYANGDVTTKYGKMRADNGHPEPFNLEYIEIGNENYNFNMDDNSDQSDHYPERYIQFYNAIKEKYPNVKCIGNVESWATDYPSWRNDYPVEIVDEHYYRNPKWFADRFNKYDDYDRSKHKVYVGEYAVTSNFGEIGNLNAALGEAVYMMGMENNSDVVVMNSYAPIFVNENDARWRPDMIRFNSSQVMGTPSYYVQQLFPNNIGTQVVKTDWTYDLTKPEPTEEEKAQPVHVGLASWSTDVVYRDAQLAIDGKSVDISDYSKWNKVSGNWSTSDNEIIQKGDQQAAMIVCPDDIDAEKYTFKVQAKKLSGLEGFMAMFGYKNPKTYQWFNVGGWSNSQNNVEQAIDGNRVALCRGERFSVDPNRWYDLQVDVDGDSICCYLDGKLNLSCKSMKGSAMEGVFASTTIDDAAKMMYVKVVNVGDGYADGVINLSNCSIDTSKPDALKLIRLSSATGGDENTISTPHNIIPVDGNVKAGTSNDILFDVPGYSVNIIRIPINI